MPQRKISIIVLHRRHYGMTAACLQSLRRCSYPNVEIIVVDPGTTDGSADRLMLNFPEVIMVTAPKDCGSAAGYNTGMREAAGEYFLLLDNHSIVHPGFLEPLTDALDDDPAAAAASPLIRYYSAPSYIHYAGGPDRIGLIRGVKQWRGWNTMLPHRYSAVEPTTALHGAAIMVRRDACQLAGPLDERFTADYMDLEWSMRMRQAGLRILFVPHSMILLKESSVPAADRSKDARNRLRSRLWLCRKHLPLHRYLLALLYVWIIDIPHAVLVLIARSNIQAVPALVGGSLEGTFTRGS
ncbi:MAG: glycosyltransferase family 2 protein [Bacteroidetes bacterium]|nr:glycosyltransferase family 2 protein [Bacteroidota bacterium]